MRSLFKNQRGQALVEFALILPVLILLLFGIVEFGRLFAGYLELQSAARDGARYAAVHKEISDAMISDATKTYVKDKLVILEPTKLNSSGNFNLVKKNSPDNKDVWVEVTLQYPFEIITPVISSIIGNPFNLHAKMAMRRE